MMWYRRSERKRSEEECKKRLDALREGIHMEHDLERER